MILIQEMSEFNNIYDDCRNICVAFTIYRTLLAHLYLHFIEIQANSALMRTVLHMQLHLYNDGSQIKMFSWIMEFQNRNVSNSLTGRGRVKMATCKWNLTKITSHTYTHTSSHILSLISIVRLIHHADQEPTMHSNEHDISVFVSGLLALVWDLHKSFTE